jgi:hypothetical protein
LQMRNGTRGSETMKGAHETFEDALRRWRR